MKFITFFTIVLFSKSIYCQDDEEGDTKKKTKQYNSDDKYQNLLDWLRDGRAEFPKVEIEVRNELYRTLRAKENIQVQNPQFEKIFQRGEWVIFIPRTNFLTLDEVKKSCLINRKMIQQNFKPMSHQTYFVNLFLQEQRRKQSFWRPYIDVLPTDVSGFPTYFGEEELDLLRGSPTLSTVMDQRWQYRQEYDNLWNEIKEFQRFKYPYEEFLKFRILANSRYFNVNLNGEYVQILVPLADFINHDINGFLDYGYSPQHDGFFMQATRDIRKGEELFYNYGQWSNKYFFMNYGFALDSVSMNQYDFTMCVDSNHPIGPLKIELTRGQSCWQVRFVNETDHGFWREALANARFQSIQRFDEFLQLDRIYGSWGNYNPSWHTKPVNTQIEKRMWTWFKSHLIDQLAKFASTIEEDYVNLKNPNLADYRKQIIILTLKEKQLIRENIQICDLALEIVEKNTTELNQILRYYKYNKLFGYIRTELIPMKADRNE